jgi:uncharacterized protein YndB with AHSA1/START domain
MTTQTDLTIRKSILVDVPIERAFDIFTQQMADWWPTDTHSFEQGRPEVEWRPGGLAVEVAGAARHEWADVVAYDPPHRFTLRWRVNPTKPPTEVSVTFAAEGAATRVELTHSGWESFGEGAAEERAGYDSGWDQVLPHYERRVAAA